MRFMMLMIPKVYDQPLPDGWLPPADAIEKMVKYNESLGAAGLLLDLNGHHPPEKGKRVKFGGGKPVVIDGPFAEAKELVGGYWMIKADSLEQVTEWARKCPAEDGDIIEIRPIMELEEFPEEIQKLVP